MGGLITKWFVADWGAGTGGISRGTGYDTFTTAKTPEYHYLRDDNFGAGDIRRFFSLGSPFLGSPLANTLKPLLAGTVENAVIWGAAAEVSDAVKNLLFPTGDLETYNLPTAIADLAEGSAANDELAKATYPTGRKAVQWHPLVGIAGREGAVMEDLLMDLLINFAGRQGGSNAPLNFNTSDLVVHENSQRNGTGFGRGFDSHIHAGSGLGFFAEGASPIMADWIMQLLTKNPAVTGLKGT